MRPDVLVHQRLCEPRLITFIVAKAAIAEHVNDDRLVELLPEFDGYFRSMNHRFRIITIAVENWRFDHFRHIGGIGRRARIPRIGGEADLVIDNEMHRAAGAVALQAGKTETFSNDALPGKSRVAVNQQRQHLGALNNITHQILFGAHFAQHNRIDNFQM